MFCSLADVKLGKAKQGNLYNLGFSAAGNTNFVIDRIPAVYNVYFNMFVFSQRVTF